MSAKSEEAVADISILSLEMELLFDVYSLPLTHKSYIFFHMMQENIVLGTK